MTESERQKDIQLEASWLAELEDEFEQEYMQKLKSFLRQEKAAGKQIYPPGNQIFNALNITIFYM